MKEYVALLLAFAILLLPLSQAETIVAKVDFETPTIPDWVRMSGDFRVTFSASSPDAITSLEKSGSYFAAFRGNVYGNVMSYISIYTLKNVSVISYTLNIVSFNHTSAGDTEGVVIQLEGKNGEYMLINMYSVFNGTDNRTYITVTNSEMNKTMEYMNISGQKKWGWFELRYYYEEDSFRIGITGVSTMRVPFKVVRQTIYGYHKHGGSWDTENFIFGIDDITQKSEAGEGGIFAHTPLFMVMGAAIFVSILIALGIKHASNRGGEAP